MTIQEYLNDKVYYESGLFYTKDDDGSDRRIADLRGIGYMTKAFDNDPQAIVKFRTSVAEFIVDAINEKLNTEKHIDELKQSSVSNYGQPVPNLLNTEPTTLLGYPIICDYDIFEFKFEWGKQDNIPHDTITLYGVLIYNEHDKEYAIDIYNKNSHNFICLTYNKNTMFDFKCISNVDELMDMSSDIVKITEFKNRYENLDIEELLESIKNRKQII